MDHKFIENNLDEIKIDNVIINNDNNIIIPILFKKEDISIKIPEYKNEYFKLQQINHELFNCCLKLEIMDNINDFEEENKDYPEIKKGQKEALEFNNFILKLKNKVINVLFNEIKVNKNYLNMINLNELNLQEYEIDRAIWNENVDLSYAPEINKNKNDENNFDIILRHQFHVNKKTKKEKDFILKCNIIFINKKLDNKKHIFINWFIK